MRDRGRPATDPAVRIDLNQRPAEPRRATFARSRRSSASGPASDVQASRTGGTSLPQSGDVKSLSEPAATSWWRSRLTLCAPTATSTSTIGTSPMRRGTAASSRSSTAVFPYDAWHAATGAKLRSYVPAWHVNQGGSGYGYRLRLTVALYDGSPLRVVRQVAVYVTVGGQNVYCNTGMASIPLGSGPAFGRGSLSRDTSVSGGPPVRIVPARERSAGNQTRGEDAGVVRCCLCRRGIGCTWPWRSPACCWTRSLPADVTKHGEVDRRRVSRVSGPPIGRRVAREPAASRAHVSPRRATLARGMPRRPCSAGRLPGPAILHLSRRRMRALHR
jgi:hypothetical protein